MAVLSENVAACLSLAFSSLTQDKSVPKSKLKVLTANIGTLLDLHGVEKGLDQFKVTQCLDFAQYQEYLIQEVFASIPLNNSLSELRNCEGKVAEVCWLVCRKKFLSLLKSKFDDESVYKLFRIFCLLAELSVDDENKCHVVLSPSEVEMIAQKLSESLGNPWDEEDFTNLCVAMGNFPFGQFLSILATRCLGQVADKQAVVEAVHELYQVFIEDVIKKGSLSKRGYIFPTMREYWFVLRPCELSYYKSAFDKVKCGSIMLQPGNRVEPKSNFKFVLHTIDGNFELATQDHMTLLQWHTAIQNAIEYSGGKQSYHRVQALERRRRRQRRIQEIQQAEQQLQKEKSARQFAEGQAEELRVVVEEESKKLMEMEMIKDRLEKLLEEETQAKRDEEIVRGLQARLLAEEWDKREELETLQAKQDALLKEEAKKRQEYERLQMQNERELQDAHAKLETLQKERKQLDDQLELALMKTKCSDERKEQLEILLQEVESGRTLTRNKEGAIIRRAYSFMPSTKERPIIGGVDINALRKT